MTGLNARVVWERLGRGDTVADICDPLPDELHAWVKEVAQELFTERDRIITEAAKEFSRIMENLPEGWIRRDFALQALKSNYRAWLFNFLDGVDPAEGIWKTLRPSGERALVGQTEDTA